MTKWAGMSWFRFVSSMDFEAICMHVAGNEYSLAIDAATFPELPREGCNTIPAGTFANANWDCFDARKMSLDVVDPDARSLDHIFEDLSITGSENYDRTPSAAENATWFICIVFSLMENVIAQTNILEFS